MSAFFSRLFLFASLFGSFASGQGRPTNAPIYITHVTVIDTETGKEAPDRTVVILGPNFGGKRQQRRKPAIWREGRGRHWQISDSGIVGHACAHLGL